MVAGDSCEHTLGPGAGAELPEGAELPAKSNGLVGLWLKPVVCGDDFEVVKDWKASRMDDAAPRAGNMAGLRQMPQ
jgi:hypothetical protein